MLKSIPCNQLIKHLLASFLASLVATPGEIPLLLMREPQHIVYQWGDYFLSGTQRLLGLSLWVILIWVILKKYSFLFGSLLVFLVGLILMSDRFKILR